MKENKLDNLIVNIFSEFITSFVLSEPLYKSVKIRNPKWRWWKIFTKRYKTKLVLNNNKQYDYKKRITKSN